MIKIVFTMFWNTIREHLENPTGRRREKSRLDTVVIPTHSIITDT